METIFVGGATRMWLYAGDPDGTVHNSLGAYAEQGELFLNTNTIKLFFCYQGGVSGQLWVQLAYYPDVSALLASIPQANWTQATISAQDYIKNKPSLATVATSGSYNDLSNKPSIPGGQIQSDWTQSSSGSVDFIKNKPAARSQSSASRSLNSAFQPSATRDSLVNYSVDISVSLSLTTGQAGTVYLEVASDSGFTTNVQELSRFANANTGTLTIGLALVQTVTGTMSGYVPAGYYVRLRTQNNTSTPTFTYRSGQEVLL